MNASVTEATKYRFVRKNYLIHTKFGVVKISKGSKFGLFKKWGFLNEWHRFLCLN
jgi:hypothetical protein